MHTTAKFPTPLLREFNYILISISLLIQNRLKDPSQHVDGNDIRQWLRQFLGGYQIPKKVSLNNIFRDSCSANNHLDHCRWRVPQDLYWKGQKEYSP